MWPMMIDLYSARTQFMVLCPAAAMSASCGAHVASGGPYQPAYSVFPVQASTTWTSRAVPAMAWHVGICTAGRHFTPRALTDKPEMLASGGS
jgi:hypothetical protein